MGSNEEVRAYLDILCADMPDFLPDYLHTPEMQRLKGVGLFCGTDYSQLYHPRYFFSRYDHSLGVALIVWRFTHDQAQCLSGLFHDIATPVFSHSVDFMLGDSATQSSTEARTHDIIASSEAITRLLARDGIDIAEVDDYHRYPIADNDSPQLSADRLEYTLSTMLVWQGLWTLQDIRAMVADIEVLTDEQGMPELGFASVDIATRFVEGACANGIAYQRNENKLSLNYLGDLLRLAMEKRVLSMDDLYTDTEAQVIAQFESGRDTTVLEAWQAYRALDTVLGAQAMPEEGYAVHLAAKNRYINPLVKVGNGSVRVVGASAQAKALIDAYLAFRDAPYGYIPHNPFTRA